MGHMGRQRKSGATDDQIISTYADTKSSYATAFKLGVGQSTVLRILKVHDVVADGLEIARRNRRKYTDEQERQMLSSYTDGASFASIARQFGATIPLVKEAIVRAGGVLKPICPPATKDEIRDVERLTADGLSQEKIAIRLGRSNGFVARIMRANGFKHQTRAGPNHPFWKGGRFVQGNGYIGIRLEVGDPLMPMAAQNGCIAEHRLVMARSLGRVLSRTETVHHINGDRSDNRLENLQLRQGNHGKHVAMCCHACGSRNVGPIAIEEC